MTTTSTTNGASLEELLRARYGADPQGEIRAAQCHTVLETLLSHRSVRAYRSDPLPQGTLELLVAAAQSAASSSNLQAFSVVAVEDQERKARLAKLCRDQRHIHDAPLFLVWLADLSRLDRVAHQVTGESAPGLDYLESFLVAVIDAALAAQSAAVAAESLGLGTVYIGAIRNHPERVAEELGLPPRVMPVFGLVVGYPDETRPAAMKPRLPARVVLHREQYDASAEPESFTRYDEVLAAFQASQKLPTVGWTKTAAARGRVEALGTRTQLAAAVTKLGFRLD
jgi:nitroreductase